MLHSFDADMAARFGIAEAVLIQHLAFWIGKNMDAGRHTHDGRTWTYNTVKGFADLYPYLSEKQVRRVLQKLTDEGVLLTGNYNRMGMDRTLWYAFSDEYAHLPKRANASAQTGTSIRPDGQMHLTTEANAFAQTGRPIPDGNPDRNQQMEDTDAESSAASPPAPERTDARAEGEGPLAPEAETPDPVPYARIVEHLNATCGTGFRDTAKATRKLIRDRWREGFRVPDFEAVHEIKARQWLADPRMKEYLRPATLYQPTKFESYLNGHAGTTDKPRQSPADAARTADPGDTFRRALDILGASPAP